MSIWTPSQTDNGWWPRLSPDGERVLHGTGGMAFVSNWRTNVTARVSVPAGSSRAYPVGWLDSSTPLSAFVPERPLEEPVLIDGASILGANRLDARMGSWCAGRAADGYVVWYNGTRIAQPNGWDCCCSGPFLTVQTRTGIDVYTDGTKVGSVSCGEVRSHTLNGTFVCLGQPSGNYYFNIIESGIPLRRIPAIFGRESTGAIVDGWYWTTCEFEGRTYLQGHALDDSKVILRERPSGSQDWVDVVHVGGEWIVASCHDGGKCVVESIPDTEVPVERTPSSNFLMPPLAGRNLKYGYFKCISDQYGDNPSAPQNCTHVETEAEALRSPVPYYASPGVGERLSKIASMYVGLPATNVNYPPGTVFLHDGGSSLPIEVVASPLVQGLEIYSDPGESMETVRARVHAWFATNPGARVLLVGQAYDRNGAELDTLKMAELQKFIVSVAGAYQQVEGILWFSDGRRGGTRDHEEWRAFHRAVFTAINGGVTMPEPQVKSNHIADVVVIRNTYPAALNFKEQYEILNKVCLRIGNGWGLMQKTEGDQYLNTHPSVLINQVRKEIVYAFNLGGASWQHLPWNDAYAVRWVPARDISAVVPIGIIDIEARERLSILEAKFARLSAALTL